MFTETLSDDGRDVRKPWRSGDKGYKERRVRGTARVVVCGQGITLLLNVTHRTRRLRRAGRWSTCL